MYWYGIFLGAALTLEIGGLAFWLWLYGRWPDATTRISSDLKLLRAFVRIRQTGESAEEAMFDEANGHLHKRKS